MGWNLCYTESNTLLNCLHRPEQCLPVGLEIIFMARVGFITASTVFRFGRTWDYTLEYEIALKIDAQLLPELLLYIDSGEDRKLLFFEGLGDLSHGLVE